MDGRGKGSSDIAGCNESVGYRDCANRAEENNRRWSDGRGGKNVEGGSSCAVGWDKEKKR